MENLLHVIKALADRNRLRVIAALQKHAELCACQITELLQVSGATVSRHMGILVRVGLVASRKEGRWTYYQLQPRVAQAQPVLDWLQAGLRSSPDISRDRRTLARILSMEKEDLCRRQRGEACCPRSADQSAAAQNQ
jgi:ArsR family transcriptional regulator